MAGKSKHADRMASLIGEPVEEACPIKHVGGTTAQIGGAVGGAIGAGISGTAKTAPSDIEIGQFGFLGLGPERFTLTNASFSGKPTGDPLGQIAYKDVTAATLTPGKVSMRADLDLQDGRHVAFEIQSKGTGKANVGVLESLRDRCTVA